MLFGDVGCQYFILDPEGGPESPDDSLAVPPTQPRMDTNTLVIEETPAPGRKMGFGGLLVQDSDKEEEGEEVVNGASKMLQLSVDDGEWGIAKGKAIDIGPLAAPNLMMSLELRGTCSTIGREATFIITISQKSHFSFHAQHKACN